MKNPPARRAGVGGCLGLRRVFGQAPPVAWTGAVFAGCFVQVAKNGGRLAMDRWHDWAARAGSRGVEDEAKLDGSGSSTDGGDAFGEAVAQVVGQLGDEAAEGLEDLPCTFLCQRGAGG